MYNKRESAVSPVIAVVLILALVGVIVAMTSVAVLSNVDNILINDVKSVSVTVQISGDDVTVYPVSGKDLPLLEYYTVHFLGKNEPVVLNSNGENNGGYNVVRLDGNQLNAVFENVFDKGNTTYINIVGHFSDGTDAVIFTGKIEEGYVVATSTPEPSVEPTFTVTFNANGGFPTPPAQTITSGGVVTKPTEEPSKTNDEFAGWYTSEKLNELNMSTFKLTKAQWQEKAWKFGDGGDTVTDDIVLYAGWWYKDSSIYYVEGSNQYTNTEQLIDSIINWYKKNGVTNPIHKAGNNKCQFITEETLLIGKDPILISGNTVLEIDPKASSGNVTFKRGDIYSNNSLIKIVDGGTLTIKNNFELTLDGNKEETISRAPLIVIEDGGELVIGSGNSKTNLILINNYNHKDGPEYYSGYGGAIYNEGKISGAGKIIYGTDSEENKADNDGKNYYGTGTISEGVNVFNDT